MRTALILGLALGATLPLATTATAGGFGTYTFPQLTWPEPPETPTRDCPEPTVIDGTQADTCAPEQ